MNFGKTMVVLLALNLGLLGYLARRKAQAPLPDAPPLQGAVSPSAQAQPGPRSKAGHTLVTNQFRWSQLESEDYRSYIARLRAIGCPEQTIRDIIIADLDSLFAPRIRSIYPYRADLQYWQPEEEEILNEVSERDAVRQERAIEQAKGDVVKELIGINLTSERVKLQGREDYYDRRLQFLPADKRLDVRNIVEKYHDLDWQIRERQLAEGDAFTAEERAELKRIREAEQAELTKLLTPLELQQFELWMSGTAANLRHDIYGMNATEQEFLAIYNLRSQFDREWNPDAIDPEDPASRLAWEQARAELEGGIRAALGEERYLAYQRGQDPDFHTLSSTVARYQLPRAKAAEVYELKRASQDFRQAIALNPALSPEQQEIALRATEQETVRAAREALGDRAFRYYQRRAGWLGAPRNPQP